MRAAGRLWLVLLLAAVLPACGTDRTTAPAGTPQPALPSVEVRFAGGRVAAEVADTDEARRTGLMWRTDLGRDEGMLFLFETRRTGGFWMRNTLIPLQIAFMVSTAGGRYEVVSIMDMEPCRADPCPTYNPQIPYDAALEVNAEWFREAGVSVGDEAFVSK